MVTSGVNMNNETENYDGRYRKIPSTSKTAEFVKRRKRGKQLEYSPFPHFQFVKEITKFLMVLWEWIVSFWTDNGRSVEKEIAIKWVRSFLPNVSCDFSESWKDGVILCSLMEGLIPGSCPHPERLDRSNKYNNVKMALNSLGNYFGHTDIITADELVTCSPDSEEKLITFLCDLKERFEIYSKIIEKLPKTDISSQPEVQSCLIKGPGLSVGYVDRLTKITFFCVCDAELDLVIEVKAPSGLSCGERITFRSPKHKGNDLKPPSKPFLSRIGRYFSQIEIPVDENAQKKDNVAQKKELSVEYEVLFDRVNLSYKPVEIGQHRITILWKGQHIQGSPFLVNVEDVFQNFNEGNVKILKPSIRGTMQLNRNYHNHHPRKASVRFKETDNSSISTGKIIKRKILRYIVRLGNEDVAVEAENSEMLAAELLKLDCRREGNSFCCRRKSWGFVGDVERKKSVVRQFGVDLDENTVSTHNRRSSSFHNDYVNELRSDFTIEDNSKSNNLRNLNTVVEDIGKGLTDSVDTMSSNESYHLNNDLCSNDMLLDDENDDIVDILNNKQVAEEIINEKKATESGDNRRDAGNQTEVEHLSDLEPFVIAKDVSSMVTSTVLPNQGGGVDNLNKDDPIQSSPVCLQHQSFSENSLHNNLHFKNSFPTRYKVPTTYIVNKFPSGNNCYDFEFEASNAMQITSAPISKKGLFEKHDFELAELKENCFKNIHDITVHEYATSLAATKQEISKDREIYDHSQQYEEIYSGERLNNCESLLSYSLIKPCTKRRKENINNHRVGNYFAGKYRRYAFNGDKRARTYFPYLVSKRRSIKKNRTFSSHHTIPIESHTTKSIPNSKRKELDLSEFNKCSVATIPKSNSTENASYKYVNNKVHEEHLNSSCQHLSSSKHVTSSFIFQNLKDNSPNSKPTLEKCVKDMVKDLEQQTIDMKERQISRQNNFYSYSLNFPPLAANNERSSVATRIRQWETTSSLPGSPCMSKYSKRPEIERLLANSHVQLKMIFFENVGKDLPPSLLNIRRNVSAPESVDLSTANYEKRPLQESGNYFDERNRARSFTVISRSHYDKVSADVNKEKVPDDIRERICQKRSRRRFSDPGWGARRITGSLGITETNSLVTLETASSSLALSMNNNDESGDEYIDDEIPDYAAMFLNEYELEKEILFEPNELYARPKPEECNVFGGRLYYGYVAEKNHFQVLTKGAGRGTLSVSLQGSSVHDVANVSVTYLRKSIYDVCYQVMGPGYYLISVKWSDIAVPGSPFICKVTY